MAITQRLPEASSAAIADISLSCLTIMRNSMKEQAREVGDDRKVSLAFYTFHWALLKAEI
jgi:hypothetical protein